MAAMRGTLVRGGVLTVGFYAASLLVRSYFPTPRVPKLTPEQGPRWVPSTVDEKKEVFDRLASSYDRLIFSYEAGSVEVYRRLLLSQYARGRVLEVGAGTGRNMSLYDGEKVASVMLLDNSPEMIQQAKKKYEALRRGEQISNVMRPVTTPGNKKTDADKSADTTSGATANPSASSTSSFGDLDGSDTYFPAPAPALSTANTNDYIASFEPSAAHLKAASASTTPAPVPLPPRKPGDPPAISFALLDVHNLSSLPDGSFDTVVDSMGLCSYSDPLLALQEMARVVRLPPPTSAEEAAEKAERKKARKIQKMIARDTDQVADEEEQVLDDDGSGVSPITPVRATRREGRLLLLEHGFIPASTPWWRRQWLSYRRETHARAWGCRNDLDVDALVKATPGLRVIQRWEFGSGSHVAYLLGAQAIKKEKEGGKQRSKDGGKRKSKRGQTAAAGEVEEDDKPKEEKRRSR